MTVGQPGSAGLPGGRTGQQRNLGLDMARALAISMVMISHILTATGAPVAGALVVLDTIGQAGVELFFSLSGFLIGGILLRMARGPFNGHSVLRFMIRRWFRTLPLYFIVLASLGFWLHMDIRHSLLLVQNFYPTEPRALPVSWSLVMEEYFYLAFPLAMLLLAAMGGRGGRLVLVTAIGLIVTCSGLRLWNAYGFGPGWPAPFVHENPLLRLDCAAYGVLGAWVFERFPKCVRTMAGRGGWNFIGAGLALAGLTASALVWVLGCSGAELVAAGFLQWGPAFLAMQPALFDLAFAVAVLGATLIQWDVCHAFRRLIVGISLVSYSTYLLHLAIIGQVQQWTGTPDMVRALAILGLTGIASVLSYRLIERPFLAVRDRTIPT